MSTIYGVYDANSCGGSTGCLTPPPGQPLATNYATNGGTSFDTPALYINNNTPYDFTNVTITLSAYQGINNGSVTTVPAGVIPGNAIPADTIFQINWSQTGAGLGNPIPASGHTTAANLFTYDYDDYYSGDIGSPLCTQGHSFCVRPGNFDVTFTATWNNPAYGPSGTPIYAQFSPDPAQHGGNALGTFEGWEGLDPTGLGETDYDEHSGSEAGVLANIYMGTAPVGVPEPASIALVIAGLVGFGALRRYRKS